MQSRKTDKDYLSELKQLLESVTSVLSSIKKINLIDEIKLKNFIERLKEKITILDNSLKSNKVDIKVKCNLLECLSDLIKEQPNLHVTARVVLETLKVIPQFTLLLANLNCYDQSFLEKYSSHYPAISKGALAVKEEKIRIKELKEDDFEKNYLPRFIAVRNIIENMKTQINTDHQKQITSLKQSIKLRVSYYEAECYEIHSREERIKKLKYVHEHAENLVAVGDSNSVYPAAEDRNHINLKITQLQNEINQLLTDPDTKKRVEDCKSQIESQKKTLALLQKKNDSFKAFSPDFTHLYDASYISETVINKNWSNAMTHLNDCARKKEQQEWNLKYWFYLLFQFCRDYNETHFDYPQQLHAVLKKFTYADSDILKVFKKAWIEIHPVTEQKYVSLAVYGLFTNKPQLPIDVSNLIATHVPREDGGRVAQVCKSTYPNHPKR